MSWFAQDSLRTNVLPAGEVPDSRFEFRASIICSDIALSSSPLGFLWNILPSSDQIGQFRNCLSHFLSSLHSLFLLKIYFYPAPPFRVQLEPHLREVFLPSPYQKGSVLPLFSHNRYYLSCLFALSSRESEIATHVYLSAPAKILNSWQVEVISHISLKGHRPWRECVPYKCLLIMRMRIILW